MVSDGRRDKMLEFGVVACMCWSSGLTSSNWNSSSVLSSRPQRAGLMLDNNIFA